MEASVRSHRYRPFPTHFRRRPERGALLISASFSARLMGYHQRTSSFLLFLPLILQEEFPYAFVAVHGARALVDAAGPRLLPIIPSLIVPLRNALNTRRPALMVAAINILQAIVLADTKPTPSNPTPNPVIGRALVPYYRQLLPIMNIYLLSNRNLGDKVDYGQRRGDCLGDRITETLQLLEQYGGDDAFVNIKYLIPTHESVTRGVSVSGFGMTSPVATGRRWV
jgi:Parkin co-regulated protein